MHKGLGILVQKSLDLCLTQNNLQSLLFFKKNTPLAKPLILVRENVYKTVSS